MVEASWRQPFASLAPGQPRTVGDIATPSALVSSSNTGEEVDDLFHGLPNLMSVIVSDEDVGGRIATISRLDFYREMTGRLDFGHALHSRRPVRDLATWDPMELAAGMPIDAATAMVLERGDRRYEDIVVRWPDGAVGTVSAATVFESLAGLYGHQAMHDPLTGLPNRMLLADRVQHALESRKREGRGLAVLFVDIDDFKTVNDSLGHHVGDRLLVLFAERMKLLIRPSDTLARLGGDEFALLMGGLDSVAPAEAAARRIGQSLRMAFELDEELIHIAASVGVVFVDGEVESAQAVLRDADLAMYSAKRKGHGNYSVFQPVMHRRMSQRRVLERELRAAIDLDQLFLVFQPQLDLRSGVCVGLEALVRWHRPTGETLYPDSFIGMAEESGLIMELDAWVLRRACLQARFWSMRGRSDLRVAVNVSGRHFGSRHLVEVVGNVLEESGLDPTRLELEVTEGVAVAERGMAAWILRELRGFGVRVAMDDFGTGHSALSRLANFPLDAVKIDRSFVQKVDLGPREQAMVRAIIDLCHALGLQVIAEGVETAAQLLFLRQHGCDVGQGYYLGRPALPESVEGILSRAEEEARLTG